MPVVPSGHRLDDFRGYFVWWVSSGLNFSVFWRGAM